MLSATAHLVYWARWSDHVTPLLCELHQPWAPLWIQYKLDVLIYHRTSRQEVLPLLNFECLRLDNDRKELHVFFVPRRSLLCEKKLKVATFPVFNIRGWLLLSGSCLWLPVMYTGISLCRISLLWSLNCSVWLSMLPASIITLLKQIQSLNQSVNHLIVCYMSLSTKVTVNMINHIFNKLPKKERIIKRQQIKFFL